MFLKTSLVSAAALLFATNAFAQAPNDRCADVLRDGTFQWSQVKDNSYFQQIVWSRFLRSTFESSKTDRGGGFGIPVGEIVLGGNYSEAQYNAKKQQIQSEYFNQVTSSREIDVALSSGDPEIVGAWSRCMSERSGGLSIRFDPVSATDVFLILEYRIQGSQSYDTLDQAIALPAGVQVVDGAQCLQRRRRINAGNPCTATLRFASALTTAAVVVNGRSSGDRAWLPARITLAREVKPYAFQPAQRLEEYANKRTATPRATVTLTPQEISQGWAFDTATAQLNLYVVSVNNSRNRCFDEVNSATPYSYTYGYTIYAGNRRRRDGHIHCAANPVIMMKRDVWVAEGPSVQSESLMKLAGDPYGGEAFISADRLTSIFDTPE